MKEFNVEIGRRIKEKRVEFGLTREEFSRLAHISDKFLYEVEKGRKGISAETLYNIAVALDVSADWLLTGKEFQVNRTKILRRVPWTK